MNRFYLDAPFTPETTLSLEGGELHHLAHVVRIAVGEEIELVNGRGGLARAKLLSLTKQSATLHLLSLHQERATPPRLLLGVPFMRPSKLDWVIEKGCELGVDAFHLYRAEKGEKSDLFPAQQERLHTLLIQAMKQSRRLFLPTLSLHSALTDLAPLSCPLLFGELHAPASPLSLTSLPALFVSGPESGFSEAEEQFLRANGKGVRLSPHILRAETAPLAAAAILSLSNLGT